MIVLKGIAASPGIAIGRAYVIEDDEIVINRVELPREHLRAEVKRFRAAQKATLRDLDAAEAKVLKFLGKQHARLIDAHRLILRDILMTRDVPQRILQEGVNAEYALSEALETVNAQFEKMEDEFFRERRHDLFDVGKRLLSHLLRQTKHSMANVEAEGILVAHNLLPSDTLGLPENRIRGFVTDLGGKTSHTAILAQSLQIPAVVGLSDVSRRVKNGDTVIIDGEQGIVIINPNSETVQKYEEAKGRSLRQEKVLDSLKGLPTVTLDGKTFRLEVNLDSAEELKSVVGLQSDGVGLLRTEFLFLNRAAAPDEEEQMRAYAAVLKAFDPKPVVIRTADIGGDRLLKFAPEMPKGESNPFLGLRGIRLFLRYPDLLKTQLRAALRAASKTTLKLLIPMVSSAAEIQHVRRLIAQTQNELQAQSLAYAKKVEIGLMIEIPAAAFTLDHFLPLIDFISVGTNDLIQYLLAVDRLNEHVAHLYDPFHPAVVRMLDSIVQTAHKKGKKVTVCGDMSSDPQAVPLLIGLGVDVLSVSPRMFLRVKQVIRSLRSGQLAKVVSAARECPDSETVRRLLEEQGL
jgi:phosphotransferase system enzyme I (PtsI)